MRGVACISGSKNAALPIMAATLLTQETCVLKNIPDIADVHTFLQILKYLGVEYSFARHILTINSKKLLNKELPHDYVKKLRASILLLAPILVRKKEAKLAFPGGCVIGKRSIETHLMGLVKMGAKIISDNSTIHLQAKSLKATHIINPEISVTATENLILAAVLTPGKTVIKLAAAEPHVQDLCLFLRKMGSKIKGIGTHFLEITGVHKLKGVTYNIISDYLEGGTLAIAAAVTKGEVFLKNIPNAHLDSFWQKMEEIGVNFVLGKNTALIKPPRKKYQAIKKLETGVFPKFPTDLQAPLAVLLSQAKGVSKIFETLFESRLGYLFELEKLGANVEILNPHQAIIIGATNLVGNVITSCDIRAGAAMVVAALAARGKTEIADINYTDRGYEGLDQKLRALGGEIERG